MLPSKMSRSLSVICTILLPCILFNGRLQCTPLKAAMNTSYKLHVREFKNHNLKKVIPIQAIEIEANHLPLSIHFRSRSSKLKLSQSHASNRPEFQQTNSIEEPDILMTNVRKPVLHQLLEVIVPYRKTIQEVRPTQEELKQIFASQENADEEEHVQRHPETWLNQYSPASTSPVAAEHSTAPMLDKSAEKDGEHDNEIYSALMEDSYSSNDDTNSLQQDEPSIESGIDLPDSNELDETDEELMRDKLQTGKSTSIQDHIPQPSFQRRRAVNSKQYPLMKELQRMATGYMWTQYAKQMKHYRKAKHQYSSKPQYLKHHKNRHDDMIFGDSKTAPKYVRKKWPSSTTIKRTSGDSYSGVVPGGKNWPKKATIKNKYRKMKLPSKRKNRAKSIAGKTKTSRPIGRSGKRHFGAKMTRLISDPLAGNWKR